LQPIPWLQARQHRIPVVAERRAGPLFLAPVSVRAMPDFGGELSALVSETRFSGVIRIDQDDRIELARAYGLAHRGFEIPNQVDTRFAIASGAKGFTALAVVSLIEEGVLELSTPARSVLGHDLPLVDDGVTIEQLLAHRSGIGDYLDEEAGFEVADYVMPVPVHRLATTEDYLAVLDGYPSKFAPGERFAYSNGGFVVLALIAERTSGVPFHELVEQRVCRPAGMMDTEYLRSDELPARTALGYVECDGVWRTNVFHLPVRGSGDGGIYSTAADISALWRAFVAGRIVSTEWVAQLVRPPQRRAKTVDALRPGLLAPRLDRRRRPGRLRRRGLFPFAARSARARDGDGDLERG
jgi:CubicO group peptidase (beta-lactamase class C family)